MKNNGEKIKEIAEEIVEPLKESNPGFLLVAIAFAKEWIHQLFKKGK